MSDKTHYRKAFDSPYLSSADIVDPIVVTIQRVALEKDKTKKTPDEFNTCYWQERFIRPGEPLKPMILNATNSKFLATLTGSKWIDDWAGTVVEVYVDGHVRFGKETVEGLRMRKAAEQARKVPKEVIDAGDIAADGGSGTLKTWWESLGEDDRVALLTRLKPWKARAKQIDATAPAPTEGATA